MLYPNGQRIFCYPGRHVAGALAASGAMAYGGLRGARINRVVSEVYSKTLGAVPSGYSGKAWLLAVTAGGIAGFSGLSISPTGEGVLGMPGEGAASLVFTVADAEGQLISSGSGSAALSLAIADALLTASISGTGTAALSITVAPAAMGAIADIEAAASFVITGSLVPYAVGSMSGSTVDNSVLTSDSIAGAVWSAASSAFVESGTMGNKLNSAASGGVDYAALAEAVRTELGVELARIVDIAKIHGLVIGTPLVVTPTSRTAGDITQAITGDGLTTSTVQRA